MSLRCSISIPKISSSRSRSRTWRMNSSKPSWRPLHMMLGWDRIPNRSLSHLVKWREDRLPWISIRIKTWSILRWEWATLEEFKRRSSCPVRPTQEVELKRHSIKRDRRGRLVLLEELPVTTQVQVKRHLLAWRQQRSLKEPRLRHLLQVGNRVNHEHPQTQKTLKSCPNILRLEIIQDPTYPIAKNPRDQEITC